MATTLQGLDIAVTTSIAWTANEDKTTEKQSSALTLVGGVPLSERDAYLIEIVRPAGNTPDGLTTYVYNVSEVEEGNERNSLVTTLVTETASDASAVQKVYAVRGLFLGTANSVKLGMKFGTNQTATAITAYARIVRTALA
jgi:hypothetical protein